ncbi:MAG: hypothetical protein ACF8OB_13295 [Phycisphaeraceae bacterium JB051]
MMPASIKFPGVNHEDGIILTHTTCRCGQSLKGLSIHNPCPVCQRPASEAILRTLVKLDEQGQIDDDLACETCQYNLRTQPYQSQCPECGSEIVKSIISNNIFLGNPRWHKKIRRGMTYFMLAIGSTIALQFLLPSWMPSEQYIRMLPYILMIIGMYLISTTNPRIDQAPKHRFTTVGLRVLSIVVCLSSLLNHLLPIILLRMDIPWLLYARYTSLIYITLAWVALLAYWMRLGQLIQCVKPGHLKRTSLATFILLLLWLPMCTLLISMYWFNIRSTPLFHNMVSILIPSIIYCTYALLAFLTFATRRLYGRRIKEQMSLTS